MTCEIKCSRCGRSTGISNALGPYRLCVRCTDDFHQWVNYSLAVHTREMTELCDECVESMGVHPKECAETKCIFCGGYAQFYHNRMSFSCLDCDNHWGLGEVYSKEDAPYQ